MDFRAVEIVCSEDTKNLISQFIKEENFKCSSLQR